MKDFTEIVVVLDKSSSMASISTATIKSFNDFVSEQSLIGDNANLSLYTFSDETERVFVDKPIRKVEKLDYRSYSPMGWTAMNDAIGLAIDELGVKLSKMNSADRPDKVVFVIITDGAENKSKRFSTLDIREKISHQKDKYNWQFLFLGANIDAVATGRIYNLAAASCMQFTADSIGTAKGMESNTRALRNFRTGLSANCNYAPIPQSAEKLVSQ